MKPLKLGMFQREPSKQLFRWGLLREEPWKEKQFRRELFLEEPLKEKQSIRELLCEKPLKMGFI